MAAADWRPGASQRVLLERGAMLQQIRSFFAEREVLEVSTPVMLAATAAEPHLHSFRVEAGGGNRYLQTSPEFAMKRLLAADSGPIYQLCPCFRRDEASDRHNPEFTMLEWYQPGYGMAQLMEEVAELVAEVLGIDEFGQLSYRHLFEDHLGLNPHSATTAELEGLAREHLELQVGEMDRSGWLDLLMSHLIEPQLQGAVFAYEFPVEQASLSRIFETHEGDTVACRFELYIDGMEIANGYHELLDADELQRRADQDNALRRQRGLPEVPVDPRLLAAHQHGLPDCAGVALGVDRLLMLKCGVASIDEVLTFSSGRI